MWNISWGNKTGVGGLKLYVGWPRTKGGIEINGKYMPEEPINIVSGMSHKS